MIPKYTALERINALLDKDSFCEIGKQITNNHSLSRYGNKEIARDGVITGYGYIEGNKVFIYSQDWSAKGGTLGEKHGEKIANLIKIARKCKCPIVGIHDSGGARIQEGINSLAGYGKIFKAEVEASGIIPQICIIAGSCAGGAAYSCALMDFVYVIKNMSQMYVTGPDVIKAVCGQCIDKEDLGGATVHSKHSGVAHFMCESEQECYGHVKKLIKMLPSCSFIPNWKSNDYIKKKQVNIGDLVPANPRKVYNVKSIINEILDNDSFIEVQAHFACNIVVGLGKLGGILIGIVANQPNVNAGVIDCNASIKGARFIRFCNAFNIPILTLVDVPGFLPGSEQEYNGIIRQGAKLIYAYSEATTIKITLLLRKAYGGAYISMCSKQLGADMYYSWPSGEIAIMGSEGAVSIIYKKQLQDIPEESKEAFKASMMKKYDEEYINIKEALRQGFIDEVLYPEMTRERIFNDLLFLNEKYKDIKLDIKKGNMPL